MSAGDVRATRALALALLAAACGKRGDPLPPLPRTPQAVADLRAAQRGDRLEVSYVAPRLTTGGAPLPVLEVELLRAEREGVLEQVAQRQARRVAPGERLVETLPLPPAGTVLRVAARARSRGAASTLTPVVSLKVEPPPPIPSGLVARLQPDGVALSWTSPFPPTPPPPAPPTLTPPPTATPALTPAATPAPAPTPESTPAPDVKDPRPPPATAAGANPADRPPSSPAATPQPTPTPRPAPGFWVYRREGPAGAYGRPLSAALVRTPAFADTGVQRGEQWCYVVRSVVGTDPVVESAPSDEACVAVQDVFAPAAPTGVAALLREGGAEVSWSPSPEADLARYRVYRSLAEGAPARVAEVPSSETVFREAVLPAGLHVYTVTALDGDGNESVPSRPAQVRVP